MVECDRHLSTHCIHLIRGKSFVQLMNMTEGILVLMFCLAVCRKVSPARPRPTQSGGDIRWERGAAEAAQARAYDDFAKLADQVKEATIFLGREIYGCPVFVYVLT